MGHIGVKGLQSAVNGIPLDDSTHLSCEVCAHANIRRTPFPSQSSHRASCLLERIHCDICGPLPPCYGNFTYYILFINCYSRYITLFLMKTCDEALSLFTQFQASTECFSGNKVTLLHVDNAPELVQGQMKAYCKTQGTLTRKPSLIPLPKMALQNALTSLSVAWPALCYSMPTFGTSFGPSPY
jgi:hypothetical protein